MRRIVVALFVLVLAFSLAGCGGGDEQPTAPADGGVVDPAAAPATQEPSKTADPSDPAPAVTFEAFPAGLEVPEELAADIESKQPTLILFVDGSQKVTNEVRAAVDDALSANRGLATLHSYDLGKYAKVDSSGTAVVDAEGLDGNTELGRAAMMARDLGVKTLPYLIMTDDQGYIVSRRQGLVDAAFLEMHMARLTE